MLILGLVWFYSKNWLNKNATPKYFFLAMFTFWAFLFTFSFSVNIKHKFKQFYNGRRSSFKSNRSEIVLLSTDNIFHNLQDDVEFDINHKLRRYSRGSLASSPPLEAWTNGACLCHLDGSGWTSICFCRFQEYPDPPALNNRWYLLILVKNTNCKVFPIVHHSWWGNAMRIPNNPQYISEIWIL